MKKCRNIKNTDDAIVGIVASFLIVGLIVAVVSVIQTVYIPKWMEQQEAEHMEEVGNQFAQLKYAIGEHMLIKQKGIPISTSITLGSKELPFLMSSRAFGSLTIVPDQCTITVIDSSGKINSSQIGVIKYSSANAYYLNQEYIYEAGAVILNQNQGNTMVIKPNFLVSNEEEVNIIFTITNISTVARKNSISGYGTYPIQTEFSDNNNDTIQLIKNVLKINIDTHYQNAWHRFINGTLRNQGLNYNGYGKNYTINLSESGITVEFAESTTVNLYIKLTQIDAQVAPGWIENIKG